MMDATHSKVAVTLNLAYPHRVISMKLSTLRADSILSALLKACGCACRSSFFSAVGRCDPFQIHGL